MTSSGTERPASPHSILVIEAGRGWSFMDIEHWRPIDGFSGAYQVSDMGNVRSMDYLHTGRIQNLAPAKSSNGYLSVMLFRDGRHKRCSVHTLVAEAFIEGKSDGMEVNHKNGDKMDNRVLNLEWCTKSENVQHAVSILGRRVRPVICVETGEAFPSIIAAGRATGMDSSSIAKNAKGKKPSVRGTHWKYL